MSKVNTGTILGPNAVALVVSSQGNGVYGVSNKGKNKLTLTCTCPHTRFRSPQGGCKHVRAVHAARAGRDGTVRGVGPKQVYFTPNGREMFNLE